jgi:hypothetical protein
MTVESAPADAGRRLAGGDRQARGRAYWYRIVHGDNEIDWLGIAAVERILGGAGVNIAELTEVGDDPQPPASHGAA